MPGDLEHGPRHARVAIIGAGFAGLGMAIRLQQSGIRDFVLLDRGPRVGGTWRDNVYPGAACDVPSHLYSFSFEPNPEWSHVFARQPEIQAYLERCVERHRLSGRIEYGADVAEARFDEAGARWHLGARDGRRFVARYLVMALGVFKDPHFPPLPGVGSFAGPELHSARWDHSVGLAGRRIGVVGTGASAIQLVPELARVASHVTVFQRTPAWVAPRKDRTYSEAERRRFRRSRALVRLQRTRFYGLLESQHPLVFGRSTAVGSLAQWRLRRIIRRHIEDPALVRALTPDYRLGCKRVLVSDDWYPTLAQPHVEVECAPIARILPRGVALADERTRPLDALVYCTGFTVQRFTGDMRVRGRGGVELTQWWGRRPRAYLGICVPGFPNAFMLLGPNTGLGHNSILVMIEAQIEYTLQAIRYTEQRPDLATLEADPAALERFVEQLDRAHRGSVWETGCRSWYHNERGENFALWPRSTIAYLARTRRFDPEAYRKRRRDARPRVSGR